MMKSLTLAKLLIPFAVVGSAAVMTAEIPQREANWTLQTGGVVFAPPAIGPQGAVIVGSHDGNVYCINPDGSLRWTFATDDWVEAAATVAAYGTIYVGSWDGKLYALDGLNGDLLWSYQTGSLIIGSAALAPNGTILCASDDGILYALDSAGQLLWFFAAPTALFEGYSSSPVLNPAGDTVYLGNDAGHFFAVDVANGSLRWSYSVPTGTNRGMVAPAAIGDLGEIYFTSRNGSLYALSSGGDLIWSFPTTGPLEAAPVISSDQTIIFPSHDGYLYFVDNQGFQVAEVLIGDVFYCSPALDRDGNVIIVAYSGSAASGAASTLMAVNPAGSILWQFSFDGVHDSSPNIAPDGSIYTAGWNGMVYQLPGGAALAQTPAARYQGNRQNSGWAADISRIEMIDLFPAIRFSMEDWSYLPWFGSGWIKANNLPGFQHSDHGNLHHGRSLDDGVWCYDSGLQSWVFAFSDHPHLLFDSSSMRWLLHVVGTTSSAGRWFYDYAASGWLGPIH